MSHQTEGANAKVVFDDSVLYFSMEVLYTTDPVGPPVEVTTHVSTPNDHSDTHMNTQVQQLLTQSSV